MADAFSLEGLVKRFGDVLAVDDVSVRVAPGEVVALLGPNGAGKSTTIDMLLGLTRPDSGQVRVAGVSAAEAMDRGTVGAMAQNGTLLRDATVAELVGLFASLHRNPLPTREVLKRAGVTEYANRRCGKLSGGEQQRVRFALALVGDPELLVLDEPTAAMDVEGRRRFWASMREYTETGRTVLFATHYLAEAEDYADRVVLMRHGRVVADGPVGEVRAAVAGRMLRAVIPDATQDTEAALAALPGVSRAVLRAGHAELSCADSDLAIRALLREFPRAVNIEITAMGLEEAFIALTTDAPEGALR
ncbi:ABC transporter ATP-binding protein [Amycolatopsis oliviviridis]|uniref:ABC transporter ATP-binding protein n=1 Tax=Amycolatopsis oliviviridis TaxID=1471590 RepID=A0ABQ3M226_9PSEU|nr:ABC transporter ATP-binding protein [Amycolatopsis oliviviridis]GHH29886.1 ABC transporter ATP-binding protein [Amycolatopsis oliviviridis]